MKSMKREQILSMKFVECSESRTNEKPVSHGQLLSNGCTDNGNGRQTVEVFLVRERKHVCEEDKERENTYTVVMK